MRDDLIGWPEGEPMRKNDSRTMKKFIKKWIFRFGVLQRVVYDKGSENQKQTQEVLNLFGILVVLIATYHLQLNSLIELGQQQIVDALAKLGKKFVKNLDSVLWANRVIVRKSTGYSPFQLIYREDCVLLIKLSTETRAIIDWNKVDTQ